MKRKEAEKLGLPLTYKYIISWFMPRAGATVLDVACGKGVAAKIFNARKKHHFTGVDIFQPYLTYCRALGLYTKLIKQDITKTSFMPRSYDVVLVLQLIEHLQKNQARRLLKHLCKTAKKELIVTTPNGECEQHAYDNNPYQTHHSSWSANDLRKLGFSVYGQGLKKIYGEKSYAAGKGSTIWQKCAMLGSLIISPVIFFVPEISAQLIAVKKNDQ